MTKNAQQLDMKQIHQPSVFLFWFYNVDDIRSSFDGQRMNWIYLILERIHKMLRDEGTNWTIG